MSEKQKQVLISVIIPVYQAASYLDECLGSLLAQSYQHYELILIDDGSTDGSGDICERYAAEHSHIRVLHQSNRGVSAARNAGLACAVGDYICFVDSDDRVSPDFLEALAEGMQREDTALVLLPFAMGQIDFSERFQYLRMRDSLSLLTESNWGRHIWGMAFKGSNIRAHQLHFPEDCRFGEDTCFLIDYFLSCEGQGWLCRYGSVAYHFRDTPGSLSKSSAGAYYMEQISQRVDKLCAAGYGDEQWKARILEACRCKVFADELKDMLIRAPLGTQYQQIRRMYRTMDIRWLRRSAALWGWKQFPIYWGNPCCLIVWGRLLKLKSSLLAPKARWRQ